MIPSRTWYLAVSLLLAATFAGSGTIGDETDYQERAIHGWRIVVEARLAENQPLVAPMIEKLEAQLSRIAAEVPSPQVDRLRETPIWLVHTGPHLRC